MANNDIINYLKHQYEGETTVKNKLNYANELGNSKNKSDILKAINLLIEIQNDEYYDLNYRIAVLYRKLGNIEKSIEYFDKDTKRTYDEILLEKGKTYSWFKKYEKALELFDDITDVLLEEDVIIQKIKCYIELNDKENIEELYNEAIKHEKISDICSKKVGLYYYEHRNDVKAYECLSRVSEKNMEYMLLFRLGHICLNSKKYEEALSYYLKAYKYAKNGTTDYLDYKIGSCYEGLNNYEKALEYYKKSLTNSNDNYAYLKIGKLEQQLYEKKNDLDHLNSAKYYLTKGSSLYPGDIYIKYELVKVYLSLGNLSVAYNYAMAILEKKEDRYTLIQLVRIYYLESNYDLAIELCEKLLKQKEDKFVRLNLCKCYIEKGMYNEALFEVNKLLMTNEKDYYGLIEKARIFFRLGQNANAKEVLNKIPNDVNIKLLCEKMTLLSCVGEFETAYEQVSKKIDENPNNSRLNMTMSNILEGNGYIIMAIQYNLRAIESRRLGTYIEHLAGLYFANGEYDKAKKYYLEYMNTENNYAAGAIGLINVYMQLKEYENAYNLAYQILTTYKHDLALAVMAEIELLMGHRNIAENYLNEIIDGNSNREDSSYVKRLKSLIYG